MRIDHRDHLPCPCHATGHCLAAAQAAAQAEKAARDATALMIENGVSSANAAALVGGSDSERANGSSSEILSAGGTMSATVNPSTLGAEASYMVVDGGSDVDEDEENDEDDENNHKGDVDDVHRSGWQAWAILHL